jgi:DNA-binding MarR family transcriptional regulator
MTKGSTSMPARAAGRAAPKVAREAAQALFDFMMIQKVRLGAIAERFDLSPVQAMTLFTLDPQAPVPMSSFAQQIRCEPSNVTVVIDKLEARGLVERRATSEDRRVKLLHLTDPGAELRARLVAALMEPPEWLLALPADEQRLLRDVFRRALACNGT